MRPNNARIERMARGLYETHWGEQITERYPPCWVDLTERSKNWVRVQARTAIELYDELAAIPD